MQQGLVLAYFCRHLSILERAATLPRLDLRRNGLSDYSVGLAAGVAARAGHQLGVLLVGNLLGAALVCLRLGACNDNLMRSCARNSLYLLARNRIIKSVFLACCSLVNDLHEAVLGNLGLRLLQLG